MWVFAFVCVRVHMYSVLCAFAYVCVHINIQRVHICVRAYIYSAIYVVRVCVNIPRLWVKNLPFCLRKTGARSSWQLGPLWDASENPTPVVSGCTQHEHKLNWWIRYVNVQFVCCVVNLWTTIAFEARCNRFKMTFASWYSCNNKFRVQILCVSSYTKFRAVL